VSTATWTTDQQRTAESSSPSRRPTLTRRKCSCGGRPGLDGECAACRAKRLSASRPRTASAPNPGGVLPDFATLAGAAPTALAERSAKAKGPLDRELPSDVAHGLEPELPEPAAPVDEEEAEGEPPAAEAGETEAAQAEEPEESPEPGATKAKIVFRVVEAPPLGPDVKRWCPAPRPSPVGFGVRRSTAAQIAAMLPCDWGITAPDPLIVQTRVCHDGPVWRLRVSSVFSVIRTFSRHVAGEREPTVGNSTAANFCPQVTDLDGLGTCPGGNWYMLAAVRAHEQVHVDEWRTSMGTDWPAQQAIIEGLTVPRAGATRTWRAAYHAMRGTAAFRNAIRTNPASGNYPAFWGIPDPNVNTDAAERVIIAPRIRQLCVNARTRGWGPGACPVCAANGIT
jgi:hypothetical protein